MTKDDFEKLKDGDKVWFCPTYFAFPMLGVVKHGYRSMKGVWVNFFGEGQCLFAPLTEAFYCAVSRYVEGRR